MTLTPVSRGLLVLMLVSAAGASAESWPSTSLLAQQGDPAPLPPPDELQDSGDPADDHPAAEDPADEEPPGDEPPAVQADPGDEGGDEHAGLDGRERAKLKRGDKPAEPPSIDDKIRDRIPDMPTPLLGALGAAVPVAAVQSGVLFLTLSMLAGGFLVDAVMPASFIGTVVAAAGTGLVMLLGATASTFLGGAAILWLLNDDATDTEWEHLTMATLAVVLFFIVAPVLIAGEFFGFPCGRLCCPPGGLNAFAPRVSRPLFWMLGAGVAGGLLGLLVGGLAGFAIGGQYLANPSLAAFGIRSTVIGGALGLTLGGALAAPLGAAVGGSFGIVAQPTGE